jgi:DNA-directed RNA polymerase specialized sigma24 family protein
MVPSLASHRDRFASHEWQRLMKFAELYVESYLQRTYGGRDGIPQSGEEIVGITLQRVQEEQQGYAFRDGDILFFFFLCRCCRKTVRALHQAEPPEAIAAPSVEDDEDTPATLTEQVAVAFLQRRQSLELFQAFLKEQKLQGKLRAYGAGFPKYGADDWDAEQIAKDLRVTPGTVAKYRSRLRDFLEEFEIQRARRKPA